MASVILAKAWFGPDSKLYKPAPRDGTVEIPEKYIAFLPRSAQVVGGVKNPTAIPNPHDEDDAPSLKDLDLDRAQADAVGDAQDEADKNEDAQLLARRKALAKAEADERKTSKKKK